MAYLQAFNNNFPALFVRFQRAIDRSLLVVWVEVRAVDPSAEETAAQQACLSSLINYFGIPSSKRLPNIVDFYKKNWTLFHPVT